MSSSRKTSRCGPVASSPRKTSVTSKGPTGGMTKKNDGSNEIRIGKDSNRVKVYVRIRPFSKEESSKNADDLPFQISTDNNQVFSTATSKDLELKNTLCLLPDDKGYQEKNYNFDHVFQTDQTNKEVSDTLTQPLVQSAMKGFNGTLMAYGQTGAGKTYSLMGDSGITKTMIDKCFNQIYDDIKHSYKVTVSYLQIYQEKIFDLLSNINNAKNVVDLTIRENPRTGVYVDNLSEYVVRSPAEVLQYISNGKKKLVFAETKMNRTSSRSHAVFQMVIERTMKETEEIDGKSGEMYHELTSTNDKNEKNNELDLNAFGKDVIIRGKIHICDLAGSERIKRTGASGDRLNEAMHINSSLLELGNVIQALASDAQKHVPFRNSVLTRLLQESLGGNCKTSLIVCISPSIRDLQETKCTLNFGSRAMKVTNTAYVNMEVDFKSLSDQLLKQLQAKEDELSKIREKFAEDLEEARQDALQQAKQEYEEMKAKFEKEEEYHADEVKNMKEQICLLEDELEIKSTEVQEIEESIILLDDISKRDKHLMIEMIKTEKCFTKCRQNDKADGKIKVLEDRIFKSIIHNFNILNSALPKLATTKISVHEAIDFLTCIQTDLFEEPADDVKIDSESVGKCKQELCNLRTKLIKPVGGTCDNDEDPYELAVDEEFYATLLKAFFLNRIRYIENQLNRVERLSLLNEIEKTTKENERLLAEIKTTGSNSKDCGKKEIESNSQQVSPKDQAQTTKGEVVDVSIQATYNTTEFGSQTELKNITENIGGKQEPESEEEKLSSNVVDGKSIGLRIDLDGEIEEELKEKVQLAHRSSDIFHGFSSTLNRIEDMVKSERTTRPLMRADDSYRSLSSFRDGTESYRSSSSYGYRADDSFRSASSFGSRGDDSFRSAISVGSRGNDSFRSTFSNRYEDPFKETMKYKSPYTTSFTRGNSMESFDTKISSKSFGNFLSSNSEKYDTSNLTSGSLSARDGIKKYNIDSSLTSSSIKEDRIKELVSKINELEKSLKDVKQENQDYVNLVQELSSIAPNNEQLQEIKKRIRIFQGVTNNLRKDSKQIAHIKPFSTDGLSEAAATTTTTKSLSENDSLSVPSTSKNLMEFSPDVERKSSIGDNITISNTSLSASMSNRVHQSSKVMTSTSSRKSPPQDIKTTTAHSRNESPQENGSSSNALLVNSYFPEEIRFSNESHSQSFPIG